MVWTFGLLDEGSQKQNQTDYVLITFPNRFIFNQNYNLSNVHFLSPYPYLYHHLFYR